MAISLLEYLWNSAGRSVISHFIESLISLLPSHQVVLRVYQQETSYWLYWDREREDYRWNMIDREDYSREWGGKIVSFWAIIIDKHGRMIIEKHGGNILLNFGMEWNCSYILRVNRIQSSSSIQIYPLKLKVTMCSQCRKLRTFAEEIGETVYEVEENLISLGELLIFDIFLDWSLISDLSAMTLCTIPASKQTLFGAVLFSRGITGAR